MATKDNPYKIVLVEWDDAHAHFGDANSADFIDPPTCRRKSVGWLIKNGRKAIVIAGTDDRDSGLTGETDISDVLTIVRGMIASITYLAPIPKTKRKKS